MRTTVRLHEQTLRDAKKLAADTDRTRTAVIEDALREVLARREERKVCVPGILTVCGGKGLLPGIDLVSRFEVASPARVNLRDWLSLPSETRESVIAPL